MPERRLTRRDVLVAGGCIAAGAVVASPAAAALRAGSPLRRATYLALSDRTFGVRRAGLARQPFTLREVADLPRAATLARYRGSDAAFSLLFDGPAGLRQDTYTLDHPSMGRFALFLTPVGQGSRPQTYQAIVDRLYRPTARHPAPS
jgi:hypothetical protein